MLEVQTNYHLDGVTYIRFQTAREKLGKLGYNYHLHKLPDTISRLMAPREKGRRAASVDTRWSAGGASSALP